MKRSHILLLAVLILLGGLAYGVMNHRSVTAIQAYRLTSPATDTSFLYDEAGITVYANLSTTIRLDYVASAFRTIEDHTDDYLIGWVAVSGYTMGYDAHVYVQADGWVIAYYPPSVPVSRIMDWKYRRFTPTLLERALSQVVTKDGLTLPPISYYDFRYPNATHMLWIKKNSGTFHFNLPASFTFYERSWIVSADFNWTDHVYYRVDNVVVGDLAGYGDPIAKVGYLTEAQLLPDLEHSVNISWGSYAHTVFSTLVLVYQDPNVTP